MKIQIIKNKEPLYVYHHPRNVKYDEKHNIVKIGESDVMSFHLKTPPEIKWFKQKDCTFSELLITFDVIDSDDMLDGRPNEEYP
jgi:hypothetical protein